MVLVSVVKHNECIRILSLGRVRLPRDRRYVLSHKKTDNFFNHCHSLVDISPIFDILVTCPRTYVHVGELCKRPDSV